MAIKPYKDKNGRTFYELRAYLGIDPVTGKQKQIRRRGFATKKDAQLELAKIFNAKDTQRDSASLTYRDVYDEWLLSYQNTVRGSTLKYTLERMQNHILPKIGHMRISKIEPRFLQSLVNEWGTMFERPNKVKIVANMVFLYAVKMDYIERSPFEHVTVPRNEKPKEFENYLDKDELLAFLNALKTCKSVLWRTYFYLIAMTGMRRSEALALHWSDVNTENKIITVRSSVSQTLDGAEINPPKTKAGERIIIVGQDVIDALMKHKAALNAPDSPLVFPNTKGGTITLSQPKRQLDAIIKANNLKHFTTHGLRHTHCCLLLEAGASIAQVQQRLGHSDVKVTLEIYDHITKKKQREVPALFNEYLYSE